MEVHFVHRLPRLVIITEEKENNPTKKDDEFFLSSFGSILSSGREGVDLVIMGKEEGMEKVFRGDPDFILFHPHLSVSREERGRIRKASRCFDVLSLSEFLSRYGGWLEKIKEGVWWSVARSPLIHIYPRGRDLLEEGKIKIPKELNYTGIVDIMFKNSNSPDSVFSADMGYLLPSCFPFNHIIRNYNVNGGRCGPEGGKFSLLVGRGEGDSFFSFPSPSRVIPDALEILGYGVQTSSAPFLSFFDSFDEGIKFLIRPYTLHLLYVMSSGEYKGIGELRKLISVETGMDPVQVSQEILYMLAKKILLRGYILKCNECGLENFYSMKEVDEEFVCRDCRRKNITPLKLNTGYRLNRIMAEGYKQGMVAPLLTLNYLKEEAKESFIWSSEVRLKNSREEMEIDIICIIDGKITLGESKTGKLIKDRDFSPRDEFEKYKKLTREIGAHRVIFSTLSEGFYDIPSSKIERFRHELYLEGFQDVEVEVLNNQNLLAG